ncbi:MAG: nucleotidyltransferase domain-containing protein [Chthonomonadales bacterium]|nr:nucleotidyltransferase domain-containing protein [Chthonomonadales bacterium]
MRGKLRSMVAAHRERTAADIATERRSLEEARRLTLSVIGSAPVRAYLFGSRAVGAEQRYSDIDVALEAAEGSVDPLIISTLRETLE